ncbi:MAG: ribonuclease HI family protein [Gemmatimonadota bacterium]|nr:ribonuclease HI family protein [Gemmatimonadota bacterium]
MAPNDAITVYVDGAAKGNPGPAGVGVWLELEGVVLSEHSEYIGNATNNVAEYKALIYGLEIARRYRVTRVSVISDSELMVRQLNGEYRVKNENLLPLYRCARELAGRFDEFRIRHVSRTENRHADRLANQGIKSGMKRKS